MAQLIDSSIFIEMERRGRQLADLVAAMADEPVALASITASELLTGIDHANTPARRLRREAVVEATLTLIPVLPFDLLVALTHARLWAQLAAAGQLIGAHDLLIAATALAHGYAVLAQNVRDFRRVPGLVVRQPRW
ncbi:MAG TPA: PIN domain-containing protein [Thermomicrobiales bacterium]|nr:PIN domain-containing protein [Thermomicrobiales bacterium]